MNISRITLSEHSAVLMRTENGEVLYSFDDGATWGTEQQQLQRLDRELAEMNAELAALKARNGER